MRRPKSKSIQRKQSRRSELQSIENLDSWIESCKPDSGSNPLSLRSLPSNSLVGKLIDGSYSPYAGSSRFSQLPISQKTLDGLKECKFEKMTAIQRASLPHALCGRDILGAAKTGSGKTLAFVIPMLEKLYRSRWGAEDGVGSIIISPTRELANQIFDVLKSVGKHHGFSAGLLIGGRKDLDTEKEMVNGLNILICTPGRLLQHMDETPNFDCSQIQVLVLDEADRILDVGFKKALNAIISQLPKKRLTMLFSATQTKSVQDLARLSLKDPEYLSVHEESVTATPTRLQQAAIIVPLDQKLDMLWSFIKSHLKSRILVFLSSSKQVKFVFEAFKKLRPGISLKCLYGRMKQEKRLGIYSQFCEDKSVLFSTDIGSRGLDFNKAVDWVVQVDCPDDTATYIHRVGRTARHLCSGRSILFVMPSEMILLEKLKVAKIPIDVTKANTKIMQQVSGLMRALLVKYPEMQQLAQRAFITYLRSIHIKHDKEVFDVMKLPIDEFSGSLGLPMTPKIRFLNRISKGKEKSSLKLDSTSNENLLISKEENLVAEEILEDDEFLRPKKTTNEEVANGTGDFIPPTRVSKKKKVKINIHRPTGTRVVFDDEGNKHAPLAIMANTNRLNDSLEIEKVHDRYARMREEMKEADKEDKLIDKKRRREKRVKDKMKWKRTVELEQEEMSNSDREPHNNTIRNSKKCFGSDDDGDEKDSISLQEQEALALKLLNSMHG